MANKKVSQLTSKPSVLVTDLFPIADPSTGQLFKTTISDLGTAIGSGVSSVNTLVGAVVLDTDDIQELASPTNKWYTDTRSRAALSASSPLVYNSGTGAFSIPAATTSVNGYLTSTDWTTFNAKQAALSGTGFVKISGTTISYDNSTYLTTASAASTYLALAGGTMTGAIVGTTATFANSGSGIALGVTQSGASGDGIRITHSLSRAFTIQSSGSGFGILINNDTASTSAPFTIQKQGSAVVAFTDAGAGSFASSLTATSFIKSSGTSSQFLKADGSVDSSTYLTTGTAATTYVPYSGATGAVNLGIHSIGAQFGAFNEIVSNNNNFGDVGSASNAFKNLYGYSFIKIGGTSSQFLKADGSVDSSTYLTTASASSTYLTIATASSTYLPLAGGTLTGALNGTSALFSSALRANNPSEGATGEGLIAGQSFKIDGTGTSQRAVMYMVSNVLSDTYASGLTAQFGNFAGDKGFAFNLNTSGGYELYVKNTTWNKALTIANTGAATFSNNVGIGGPSLGDVLHIMRNGTTSYAAMRVTNTSSTADVYFGNGGSAVANTDLRNNAYVMNAAASSLVFGTSDAVRMTITSGGNVGIGMTAPNNYSLSGATVLQTTGSSYGIIQSTAGSVTAWLIADTVAAAVGTSSNHDFKFTTNNTERMRITSGGITRALHFQVGAAGIAAGNYNEFGNDDNVGYVDTVRAVNSGDFHFRFDGTSRASINRTTGVYVATSDIK